MAEVFIAGRSALADAAELLDRFGDQAALQAALLADRSRDHGNVSRFCHWRQIERLVVLLTASTAIGTVH